MGWTILQHGARQSSDGFTFTASIGDTTGMDLLVVHMYENTGANGVITDSIANSFDATHVFQNQHHYGSIYAKNATGGASHTVTHTVSGQQFPCFVFWALKGSLQSADPFGSFNQNTGSGLTSIATNSVTPSVDGAILLCSLGYNGTSTRAINAGFSTPDQLGLASGTAFGVAGAYLVQTTAAAVNPTWSWTTADGVDTQLYAFKPAPDLRKLPSPMMQAVNRASTY